MALNLPTIVANYLKENAEERFTSRDLAEWVFKTYPKECEEKRKRSKQDLSRDKDLIGAIRAEIGANKQFIEKKSPNIRTTADSPRKWYYAAQAEDIEIETAERGSSDPSAPVSHAPQERELYPILTKFLFSEFGIHSKRIDEKRSSNNYGPKGNRWLYPDLVGMEDLSADWQREIKDCVSQYADKKVKLWSFEVKVQINRSNVREAFFQAVSNSSWANFGYLVANEVREDTIKELRMLSSLHGIGLILLDSESPSESQIMIQAKERFQIDWDAANRLVDANKDFLVYITAVKEFHLTGRVNKSDWDRGSLN